MKYNTILSKSAIVAYVLVSCNANAAVTLTFAQAGPDVTATWSGSYLVPSSGLTTSGGITSVGDTIAVGIAPGTYHFANAGISTPSGITSLGGLSSFAGGPTFGFNGNLLLWPTGTTGDFSPTGTMTFSDRSLADIGATSFDNFLAFTGTGNVSGNREIRFHTVPEPSSFLFGSFAALFLVARRRSRHHR